jgi:cation diffusion facilitator family transporter
MEEKQVAEPGKNNAGHDVRKGESHEARLREGQNAALVTMVVSALLAVSKAVFGTMSGAVILTADALDSSTDVITSLAAYLGIRMARRKPDKRFQYGYYKAESLVALFIAGFIILGAVVLAIRGYERIFHIGEITFLLPTFGVAAFSGVASFWMYIYLKKRGTQARSQSLLSSSNDRLKDVLASIGVLIGIGFTSLHMKYGEGIITLIIALLVIKVGIETAKDAVLVLLDVSPSRETDASIRAVLDGCAGVMSFENLKLRKAGPYVFGEVCIKVRKSIDVETAHGLTREIETKVLEKVSEIESFTIHVEPFRPQKTRVIVPIAGNGGLGSQPSDKFARAPYFLSVTLSADKIEAYTVRKNPHAREKMQAGLAAAKEILLEKPDVIIVGHIGEIAFHALRARHVDIYQLEGNDAEEVIQYYLSERLMPLREPTDSSQK